MTARLATASANGIASPALLLPPDRLINPSSPEWKAFARSWEDLPRDTWMADGGTDRRRRYAAFHVAGKDCTRLPHQPHFQERDHNPLNGGIERWFAPMEDQAGSPLFRGLLIDTAALIARTNVDGPHAWIVEAHQFRIEALPGQPGLPTPEGMHHDGRDWVLILLVSGSNYAGGKSRVETNAGVRLLDHRLSHPGEALLLNDRAALHDASPIEAAIQGAPAWRDTLVLTFAQAKDS